MKGLRRRSSQNVSFLAQTHVEADEQWYKVYSFLSECQTSSHQKLLSIDLSKLLVGFAREFPTVSSI